MKIYNPQGDLLIDQISDSSYRDRKAMSQHNLTIEVKSPVPINFSVGCYLDYQGIRYTVRKKSAIVKQGSRHLEYSVTFESPQADAEKRTVRNRVDNKLKFPYTATPREHAELIVWNLNQIGADWQVGECIDAPRTLVSYNHTKCWDAVKTIAETFKTEFEFDCYNKKLHIHKLEYNKDNPLALAYGMGNGFKTGLRRDNVDSRVAIEILAVQAGSRNIDASKNNNHPELLLPQKQTIAFDGYKFEDEEGFDASNAKSYIVDAEGLSIQRADKELVTYEDSSIDLSNIYPMRVGTITDVEVTDKGFYNIVDSTIPEDLDYSKYRIAGEEMIVAFQKSQMLSGREFKIMQTADKLTGYKHSERKFMLVSDEQDGQTMPNSVFAPKIGDTYAVFGMMMPDEYIREDATKSGASWDMFREAVRVLYEEEQEKFLFDGRLDGIWAKRDWVNIGGKIVLGGYIRFTDDQIIESGDDSLLIRITGIKEYLNNPYSPEITLANVTASTYNDDFRKIGENEVKAENDNTNTINFVRRSWRGMMELVDNIYDPSGSFQNDLISAVAIRSMMIALGDELLQYIFMDHTLTSEVDPVITYSTTNKRLECSQANIRHMTLGIDAVQPNRSATEYLHWQIPAYNSAVLVDFPSQFYYLYLRVSKTYTINDEGLKIGTGEWFLSSEKIEFDSDPNNYILLAAFINSEESDNRQVTPLYGFAELTPGMLRINNIASVDGQSFLRLLANQFRIGNEHTALEWNIIPELLRILNASFRIEKKEGDETVVVAEIDGETGAAMFGKGAHQFKEDKSLSLADGNILYDLLNGLILRGKFESNKSGNRFIIDPETKNLQMIDSKNRVILDMRFYSGSVMIYPEITLTTYTNDILSKKVILNGDGLIVSKYNSSGQREKEAYFNTEFTRAYDEIIFRNLPRTTLNLKHEQLWNDNGYIRQYEFK